jgi:hypothetical protein
LWQQRALMKRGLAGTGRVLQRISRGTTSSGRGRVRETDWELVLEINVPEHPVYRATARQTRMSISDEFAEGNDVPVRVDPTNLKRVLIDSDALDRARAEQRAAAAEAAEARKRKLLGE